MDESAIKGLKLLQLNEIGAYSRKPRIPWTKISVEGYDTRLREYTVKLVLEKHFASCGKITHIYVPRDFERGILKSVAFMCIKGEGGEEKALLLSGTDAGGWTAIVKPALWQKEIMDPWLPGMPKLETHRVRVTGYDTCVPKIDIQMALCEHFSSCGEVTQVVVLPSGSGSIYLQGERCEDKALKINGCIMGGMNLVVESVLMKPEDLKKRKGRAIITPTGPTGYTSLSCLCKAYELKKKKMEMEMEMEMGEKKKKKKMKIELMKVEKVLKKHMENKKKMDMSTKKRMEMESLEMALF
ncbi:putative nucleotide-binding alpha-beta plait domain superfamily, RNA-binding domain superfamily [Arabidopsis thaliana]|nr:RNA-binding domain superfamily [Arabidopsis thaliana x Arabidopsis arenosa]